MTDQPDLRPLLVATIDQARPVLAAVRPEDLGRPTPCPGFDVRVICLHLVAGAEAIGELPIRGHVDDISDFADAPDDGYVAALDGFARRVAENWADDANLALTFRLPWGNLTGAQAVGAWIMEIATHTWDLAVGIDRLDLLDPALAEAVLPVARLALPADFRFEGVPFEPVVEVPDDADPWTRVAGWMGRRPLVVA